MIQEYEFETQSQEKESLEEEIVKKFTEKENSRFNQSVDELIRALEVQKQEDETQSTFENRLLAETRKILAL